jgi:hypothetical protein
MIGTSTAAPDKTKEDRTWQNDKETMASKLSGTGRKKGAE